MTRQKQLFISILSFVTFSQNVNGLKCYRCGTLTPSSNEPMSNGPEGDPSAHFHHKSIFDMESCQEFEKPETSKSPFEVECGEKQYCTKIVTFLNVLATDDNNGEIAKEKSSTVPKFSVQRGCAYAFMASGAQHCVGCGFIYAPPPNAKLNESEHICYCDTNNCNMAHMPSKASILNLMLSFIAFFIL